MDVEWREHSYEPHFILNKWEILVDQSPGLSTFDTKSLAKSYDLINVSIYLLKLWKKWHELQSARKLSCCYHQKTFERE